MVLVPWSLGKPFEQFCMSDVKDDCRGCRRLCVSFACSCSFVRSQLGDTSVTLRIWHAVLERSGDLLF